MLPSVVENHRELKILPPAATNLLLKDTKTKERKMER